MPQSFAGSLDTNVLLRLLLNDLPAQHQATLRLFQQAQKPMIVADVAMIEVVFVLGRNYRFTRPQIVEIMIGLLSRPEISANVRLLEAAFQLFLDHSALAFEDCYLAVVAEYRNALPLWTFDRQLAAKTPNAKLVPLNTK